MDIKEEERLVEAAKKIKSGPNRPFGVLWEHYAPKVRGYFTSRLADTDLAEDLTSETFEKALGGLGSFQWQGIPFSAWLFTIARNTFFDHLRKEGGKRKVSVEERPPLKGDLPAQLEELQEEEEKEWLGRALFKIEEREREIIYLKFYEGLTNRAIAKVMGLSETNVGTILYRTIQKLRREMEQD
ncbi:sigma-70 family RNA polymerase sigma factor [Candidatus Saccharibacteria bacterium]|nr:sigma-70 family RNA polymerase sigma factor [Candidatus Saccharibacteria bacterium]